MKSSPALWELHADALQWILRHRGVECVEHYVDDFIFAGRKGTNQCARAVKLGLSIFAELGVPVRLDTCDTTPTANH